MKIQNPLIKKKEKKTKTKNLITFSHNYLFLTDYSIIYKEMRKKKEKAEQECHAKIIMQKIKSNAVVCLET